MYRKHTIVSASIFTTLLIGAYFLNEETKRDYSEEQILPLAQYENMSTSPDSNTTIVKRPLSLPPFKPREYVRVGATTYVISEAEPTIQSAE
ncbi:hypothetical protein [Metabacillus iocasae]|uniref:Uncharacterized protein n=1 Tax=Priestia iocasae TaxID=2291674 RepID=A0ABS2QYT3_9BACI|nr:hypothetical protein [Metabacillus iocasae]MBM7704651.1 hypothetical protein [Metabacillus iocasae]